ncbi:MAG: hypothetical protein JW995_01510 [Melioribacteraceae bacterium]|nr:hypothetical protein [Melioribacteraceae bacterium]
MDLKKSLGFTNDGRTQNKIKRHLQYINLKLASLGQPYVDIKNETKFLDLAQDLIRNHKEKNRLLSNYQCPADNRIQSFIDSYLRDFKDRYNLRLPSNTFVLDSHGIARVLSLPPDKDEYISDIISSYRIKQGILHNPKNDRRTTKGVFHIVEGGLPVPDDKKTVPKNVFARLLAEALQPTKELLNLPYTSNQTQSAELFVSLLLRPKVSPEVKNVSPERSMEIRFFAPGSLVSNLDFVESIFGNAGDPYLPENDAALDTDHWSGHTGCVILAPHLVKFTKKDLGLPSYETATEQQKRDGMCWKSEKEIYNDGQAFKITARTDEGIILTIIADNYFGYSKKEIKTQISYAANLLGNAEEEHAGGAIAFPSYNLGDEFHDDNQVRKDNHTFKKNIPLFKDIMDVQPEGYAIDKNYNDIIYIPEDSRFELIEQTIKWHKNKKEITLKMHPSKTYIYPAGYKIRMEKNLYIPSWRLIGTVAEGTFCHKPSTVSGGGKSEISKSITDSIIYGPFFIADYEKDMSKVDEILAKDYSNRYKERYKEYGSSRPILSRERSLGSVIKLLTPSPTKYTEEYNKWLESIPHYIKGIVYIIKRFYKPEWGNNWRNHFKVDIIDGKYGNELKFADRKLVASYLRVGLFNDLTWRTYKLRQDFRASDKLQMEDDITVSTVLPAKDLNFLSNDYDDEYVKFTDNCEYRFFQRPDEAIHRGFDKQAEADIASPNTFISNFAPLTIEDAKTIVEDAIEFDKYSAPIKQLIEDVLMSKNSKYFVSSSHPRMVDGSPSKNMRYLQNRPDIVNPRDKYLAEIGVRLYRKVPLNKPVYFPVNAVLPGRRNNPPDKGIRPLAVYNPIHYQELPELFMDFICSLTGKSPSTTGAGSEGALTKSPFNALCPITDLNNALVSFILTGHDGFTTAAGYVGPKYKVDHDISILIPEIWSRLRSEERKPQFLVDHGYLEKLSDFEYKGQKVLAGRLGYRVTGKFVRTFFGRVFENPDTVFSDEMLKPELQDMECFVDGINNIVEAQKKVAMQFFNDGSISAACPPLKALLNIMIYEEFNGWGIESSELRNMFTKEYLFNSDWYKERLINKQLNDIALYQRHKKYLTGYLAESENLSKETRDEIEIKLENVEKKLKYYKSAKYLKSLEGTLGLDPIYRNP